MTITRLRIPGARELLPSTFAAIPVRAAHPAHRARPAPGVLHNVRSWPSPGIAVGNIIIAACRQSYSPPGMCGRVTATMQFLIFSASPLGALLGGILGTWLGSRHALLLTRALTGRRDLPGTVPGRLTGQVGHSASSSSSAWYERAGTRTGSL
jgi:hypothetical protein